MKLNDSYEYIVVGSGFGGAFAAYNLSKAGKEVLVVERGRWVQRDDTCWDERRLHIDDPIYRGLTPTIVNQKWRRKDLEWPDDTVGGMSTFYGAAAFRLRESDFEGPPRQNSDQKERRFTWPFNYQALSPYYDEAEALQNVAGVMGEDITEPQRESDYPQTPPKTLSLPSQKIKDAALKKTMAYVTEFCFQQGVYGAAKSKDDIGIQFADNSTRGNTKNIMLRFDTAYMQLAADGQL